MTEAGAVASSFGKIDSSCRFVLVYLLQRLSVAVQRGNVGSLLGTVCNQDGPLSVFI